MPKEAAPKPELINPLIQERLADPERDGVWWNDPRKLTVYCTAEDANYVKVWGPDMVTQMEDGDATSPAARQQLWKHLLTNKRSRL
jgi:hypothetical protein